MIRGIIALATLVAGQGSTGDSHLLIVSGIGGQQQYSESFVRWGAAMVDAATGPLSVARENVTYLAEDPSDDPARIAGRSTKENVQRVLDSLARTASPNDRIFILLIGHGSGTGGESRFNLPGPDMTADELAVHLQRFATQTVVLANTASASGDFVEALSGPNRVIVTATRTGFEGNETVFAEFFVEAFAGDGADVDKDDRVSVLEAYNYARLEVARSYETDNRLLTEHAMLDDNGDGEGTDEPGPDVADGSLAGAVFLDRVGFVASGPDGRDSILVALYDQKGQLETQIATLRNLKDQMEEATYERELEELLVQLALKNREIRAREVGR